MEVCILKNVSKYLFMSQKNYIFAANFRPKSLCTEESKIAK